jgi:outer membrane protein assembly factor BamB
MHSSIAAKWLPTLTAAAGVLALGCWWFQGTSRPIQARLPGTDRAAAATGGGNAVVQAQGKLILSNGVPAELPGAWPGFRGPNWDAISPETTPLAKAWPSAGPKVLWNIPVGEGFAGASIWKGRVYLMDYDWERQADAFRCLSLANGQEIWRYTYPMKVKRNHGMSRTVPAIAETFAVAIGPKCHVTCLDPLSGSTRWTLDLAREYNTEVPPWYAGQCPLIDGDRVILAPAGDVLMIAVDGLTGKVLWQTPNPRRWQMTHSSVTPLTFQGKKMYVYCASAGVVGVSATDGAILWETPDWKISMANVPSPLPVGDGKLFFSGGYDAGAMMAQLREENGKYRLEILFRLKQAVFGAIQQTPILFQNHIYGVRPDGQFICLDLQGKIVWQSGPANRFGNGPFMLAQGRFYLLNDSGELSLAQASPEAFKTLAKAKMLEGPDAWGPMALAGGRLIIRDMFHMSCLDVSGQ